MNISQAFERRLAHGQKCFIPFITAGDPDIETTEKIILGMAEEGADIIEIGVPFSDPAADGPVIMEANIRALENAMLRLFFLSMRTLCTATARSISSNAVRNAV